MITLEDLVAVEKPARGTSVKDQALHLMQQGVPKRLAQPFIDAVHRGLEHKECPNKTRADTFRAIAGADNSPKEEIRTRALVSLYAYEPEDKAAIAAVACML